MKNTKITYEFENEEHIIIVAGDEIKISDKSSYGSSREVHVVKIDSIVKVLLNQGYKVSLPAEDELKKDSEVVVVEPEISEPEKEETG